MDWAGESGRPLAAILESEGNEEEEEEEEEAEEEEEEAEEEDEDTVQRRTLFQEMDEAKEKLSEFEQASQALLAELSALETEFEIEKACRQQAEAYAAQVNRENVKLKRLSQALPPAPGQLPEEAPAEEPGPDPAQHYGQQLRDLQERISRLLAEKKDLTAEAQELQSRNRELQEQLEEESREKQVLRAALDRNQRALTSFKRVSQIVTQDYCEAVQQLELEQELRLHAEAFAHQMLVEKKEANRQSSILLQSVGPNAQLLRALEDVGNLTRALEEAQQQHRQQVTALEEQLATRPAQEELDLARAALAAAEEEQAQLRQRLQEAQLQLAEREKRVQELEETLARDPPPPTDPPEPPPPPPLPPPGPTAPVDPLSAIRRRKGLAKGKGDKPDADDVKARAVQEMMDRIKSGVVLRSAKDRAPLGQGPSTAGSKRKSAAMELRGILGNMRRTGRTPSWRRSSLKGRDSQLDSILQRRRRALDSSASAPEPATTAAGSPAQAAGAGSPSRPGDSAVRAAPSPSRWQENSEVVRFRPRSAGGLPKSRPTVWPAEGRLKPA
ncbi:shootin-1-like isoform X2 [Dromaius novaehollandiae]|uniref:shootin-1-like isoform X2 n=1 Tax=Dromaius novaehollandiae TaxID=8790 RepID=UPI0031202D35